MKIGVAVDTGSSGSVDVLTYEVPYGLVDQVEAGTCVLVPLGSRQIVGYVIGPDPDSPITNLKEIISIVDTPVRLDQDLVDLAKWVSNEYFCSYSKTLLSMLPSVVQCTVKCWVKIGPCADRQSRTVAESRLLNTLEGLGGETTLEDLCLALGKAHVLRLLKPLEDTGAIVRHWKLVTPEGKARSLRAVTISDSTIDENSLNEKQKAVWDVVSTIGRPIALAELVNRFGVSASSINSMIKRGVITETTVSYRRTPRFSMLATPDYDLGIQQTDALEKIIAAMDTEGHKGVLLYGVTASGKTEVYIRAIEHALAAGQTALMLLPEIALTTQVMDIFRSRLGEQVAVLHSRLSAGERYDEWCRIRQGQARVVLGARSAVFAPLTNLGLIVVDEEHEPSYKQDNPPRYHCREVARHRAQQAGCTLVLGSATPSIESYFESEANRIELVEMSSRVADRPLPKVIVADMRTQFAKSGPTIFSEALRERIEDRLAKKQQVMLFQNRRAYSTFLLCRDCGFVLKCPNCAVSLKLHSADKKLTCHHCEFEEPAPDVCPKCSGTKIGKFGIGTERVEEETRNAFPQARVLRMDRDTTSRKGAHADILASFRHGEADILVGTQMIAKGLDFPRVTLVGVISADTSLNMPDFRAPERTFQMLSQVSGRAGRGIDPGEVIIQSFDPEHYSVAFAVEHDYKGFYNQELEYRSEVGYPPYSYQIGFISQDVDDSVARGRMVELQKALVNECKAANVDVTISSPAPAPLSRLRGLYRWQLVCRSVDRAGMHRVVGAVLSAIPALRKVVTVDVDPMSML